MSKKNSLLIFTVILLLTGTLIAAVGIVLDKQQKLNEKENLLKASKAELVVYKDKDGLNKAKIEAMETQKLKDFYALESKDEEIIRLQQLVRDISDKLSKQGSATIIKTETVYDTIKEPANNLIYESLFSTAIIDTLSDEWLQASFGFKLDSLPENKFRIGKTYFNLNVQNDYELVLGRDKTGFLGLGKGKPFADIKNNNPYTSTTALRTYRVDNTDRRKFSFGPSAGVYFNGGIKPYVGVGINWTLIRF